MLQSTVQEQRRSGKILFVFNKNAGLKNKLYVPQLIEKFCTNHHFDFQIAVPGTELEKVFMEYNPTLVVAAGGDGTVNTAGKLVVNSGIPLAVIPLGSSNGFAKNLGISDNIDDALATILDGHIKVIDSLLVNGLPCFHLCDIGINARLITRSHRSWLRGMLTYGFNLIKELLFYNFFDYEVITTVDKIKSQAFAIIITNLKKFGTNALINPKGKFDDGEFEICIIKKFPVLKLFHLAYVVFRKKINQAGYSIFIRTDEAKILNPQKENIHIDGEPVPSFEEVVIRIKPRSLWIIVPAGIN
jgi:diacylglycerol kinase (ATP)